MKILIAAVAFWLGIGGALAAEDTGERVKSDARNMAHGVRDAAVDVGKQVGHGSKKAYKSAKGKIKSDVNAGKPGDGSIAAKNEKLKNAKDGRE